MAEIVLTDNDTPQESIPQITFPLLDFEKQIFVDIFEKDGLVIMAKGLNYHNILSNLLWVYKDPSNLVLVVNSSDHEEKYLMQKLELKPLPLVGAEREKAYLEGGVYLVSTRVLVVDLLKGRVPVPQVSGVVVLRAHTVLESCQEAFALRLYRQTNKTGFVKGFSNSPVSFTFGFHQVEKVMRALFLTELYLWPRFHGSVIQCLKSAPTQVEELHVPLSPSTLQIQLCLLDIINNTIKQLKAVNRTLDLQEVTLESCMTKQFHKILQSQLDCVWHQLGARTSQLVQELRALRCLGLRVLHGDCASFLALLADFKTQEYAHTNSGWILLPSADRLFSLARGRVYNKDNEFDPEPCPKWKCLRELLGETGGARGDTLVLCQDTRTCRQLHDVLTMGAHRYLLHQAMSKGLKITTIAEKYRHLQPEVTQSPAEDEEAEERGNYLLTLAQGKEPAGPHDSFFEPFSQLENLDLSILERDRPLVSIHTFKEFGDPFSLERHVTALRPAHVVLYHSDVSTVRALETLVCAGKMEPKVYLVLYAGSVEEQAYLSALRREKAAFQLLIETKATMVVPSYQDGKTDEVFNLNVEHDTSVTDTRKAGGSGVGAAQPLVVVDMREFRSELPALLHRKGLRVVPLTIAVGDYVLSPDICVERKSVSDLVGSLGSGRLHAQATQLVKTYATPILLVEFDQATPFRLQSQSSWSPESQQKLQLLTLHFPKLKLVWSPSPYATAELFAELKLGRANPDLSSFTSSSPVWEEESRAADFLSRLPGLSSRHLPRLLAGGGSVRDLLSKTQEELCEVLENRSAGRELHSILHMSLKPKDSSKDKPYKFKKYYNKY